jgi:hypothetical protein
MHRSGTSLVASWLSALGVDMGQMLLPPDKGNPRGYFEDMGFLEFQRRVLTEACLPDDGGHPDWGWTKSEQLNKETLKESIPGASSLVDSRAQGRGLWGWKDPRTTLLLDFCAPARITSSEAGISKSGGLKNSRYLLNLPDDAMPLFFRISDPSSIHS